MFFQFSPPVRPKQKKPTKTVPESETVLTLAPFTANPKLLFENVKVGQTAIQKLVTRNPSPAEIEVKAKITLDEEIKIDLSWSTKCIAPNQEDILELSWTPHQAGAWRTLLNINGGGKISRDIPVVLRSITSPKKKTKATKPLPRFVAKKMTSPVHKLSRKKSPLKTSTLPNVPDILFSSPDFVFRGKENNITEYNSSFIHPCRRDTFTVGQKVSVTEQPVFDDSLENTKSSGVSFEKKLQSESFLLNSPWTPKMAFTPGHCSTDEKSDSCNNNTTYNGRRLCLFPGNNVTFNATPEKLPDRLSTETYVTANISSETYVKDVSLKANISSETFVKESSLNISDISDRVVLNEFNSTPNSSKKTRLEGLLGSGVKEIIEADLWSNNRTNKPLQDEVDLWSNNKISRPLLAIQEEPSLQESIRKTPLKRKGDLTFAISPKRKHMGTPGITDWTTSTVSTIDTETAVWLEKQEDTFKKWLNAVLTPHIELDANDEAHPVDVRKLWKACQKQQEVEITPVAITNRRLDFLRKSAKTLYNSKEVQQVLSKVWAYIDSNKLSVRTDREIHLDLSLQADIMRVILSYNPLWLRLGLETIYETVIPLSSNSDVVGLTTFLSQNLIRSPVLLKKYKTIHSNNYKAAINKFILKKFFALVYFLDVAKSKHLIRHDPCLFCKNAPIKETREVLIGFSRDTLSSMGDITKYLKRLGYTVTHKQSYLDEFDYSVKQLGVDLRDGVRLTRVAEITLLQPHLSANLRVPAISRLQKIHNVSIVFDSFEKAGFQVMYEISPKDIVNGHKEKTLSFLWQIIFNFQTPLMKKSVSIIIKWWRSKTIVQKRAQLREIRLKKENAGLKIQRWYRRLKQKEKEEKMTVLNNAAVRIQSYVRMFLVKRRLKKLKSCVALVEERYIANRMMRKERERFERLKYAILIVQRRYRANKLRNVQLEYHRKLKEAVLFVERTFSAKLERRKFIMLKQNVVFVQRKWRGKLMMKEELEKYQFFKATVIMIQRRFRANLEMKKQLVYYSSLRESVIIVQRKWRAILAMREERTRFIILKQATIIIQSRLRGKLAFDNFQQLKSSVIFVQRKWRAKLMMRTERTKFQVMIEVATVIQRRYRETIAARLQFNSYHKLRKATVFIQQLWRAKLLMLEEKKKYETLQKTVITIQRRFRAKSLAKVEFDNFQKLKRVTIFVQRRWRAKLSMRVEIKRFQVLKQAVVVIQKRYRELTITRREFSNYQMLKKTTIFVQRKWRATLIMRRERKEFLVLKQATITLQSRVRAKLTYNYFQNLRNATILIQRKWRAELKMRIERKKFQEIKGAAVVIQKRYRETVAARLQFDNYQKLRKATIFVQQMWKAQLLMREERKRYQTLKEAVLTVQRRFRANSLTKMETHNFQKLRNVTLFIQRRWRAKLAMRIEVKNFHIIKQAVVVIQKRYREIIIARQEFSNYQTLKKSTVFIQRKWRATLAMRSERKKFLVLKQATIIVQNRLRARMAYDDFKRFKRTVIFIQRVWRGKLMMRIERHRFQMMERAAVTIQRRYRETVAARLQFASYRKLRNVTVFVQRLWRAKLLMREEREKYETLKKAVIVVQRRFRTNSLAKLEFNNFQKLKNVTVFIQRRWRAKLAMRVEIRNFHTKRQAAVVIQKRYRETVIARREFSNYQTLKIATVFIQRKWKATLAMRQERKKFLAIKEATITVQSLLRAKRAYNEFHTLKKSVIVVQRKWRAKKQQIREVNAAVTIQKYVRGFLIHKKYSPLLTPEAIAARKLLRIQNEAAKKIQAVWKGYRVRSSLSPRLANICKELKRVNEAAKPERTLGFRCNRAIQQLRQGNVNEFLISLNDLDYITRRCQQSLKKLAPSLPNHLYQTITSVNRSPGEMELCTAAASILLNIYRFKSTRVYTWIPEWMEKVLSVMLRFCDKETPVFPTLCTLMWFFLHNEEYKKVIFKTHKFSEKVALIKDKCQRQRKMVAKINPNYVSLFYKKKNVPLPVEKPDWGLDLPNKPRIFQNSIQAMECFVAVINQ